MPTVSIHTSSGTAVVRCAPNSRVMDVLLASGEILAAPCGGGGVCGKCRVSIAPARSPVAAERALLSEEQLAQGLRLACMTTVTADCSVTLTTTEQGACIARFGSRTVAVGEPLAQKTALSLPRATLAAQTSAVRRVAELLDEKVRFTPAALGCFGQICSQDDPVTLTYADGLITAVQQGDTAQRSYGAAIDIGTTTVCVYLLHLPTGTVVGDEGELSSQRGFGADVISRIDYAAVPEGALRLRQCILLQIDAMLARLMRENKVAAEDLAAVTIVGNTTMLHLFCGVNPQGIARAPFAPVFTDGLSSAAPALGLESAPVAHCWLLPGVSAYVGADIVAAMAACRMDDTEKTALLADIGTNGELALRYVGGLISCATAAGPAFEGARIRCGMGGVAGAICGVTREGRELRVATIEDAAPIGICGSGLLDAVAALLDLGIIDETGRMLEPDEVEDADLAAQMREIDGKPAFALTDDVVLTAADVREVQLAKAAVAAGIDTLLNQAGLAVEDLDTLYLAGGFGSFMNPDSAVRIGLLPAALRGKITLCGNAAGLGAAEALCSREARERVEALAQECSYIELSGKAVFQNRYVEQMMFP